MTVNEEELRRTLDFVRAHRQMHDQSTWRFGSATNEAEAAQCGTTMCFAGWTATLNGGVWNQTLAWHQYLEFDEAIDGDFEKAHAHGMAFSPWETDGINRSQIVHVRHRAMRLLGLSQKQADVLFLQAQSFTTVEYVVKELCNGRSADMIARDLYDMDEIS